MIMILEYTSMKNNQVLMIIRIIYVPSEIAYKYHMLYKCVKTWLFDNGLCSRLY